LVFAKDSEGGGEKNKALAKAKRVGVGREEGTGAFVSAALNQRGEDWAGVDRTTHWRASRKGEASRLERIESGARIGGFFVGFARYARLS
jgi:hypothetical protein